MSEHVVDLCLWDYLLKQTFLDTQKKNRVTKLYTQTKMVSRNVQNMSCSKALMKSLSTLILVDSATAFDTTNYVTPLIIEVG